ENHERGLERVLGQMRVAADPAADREYHRTESTHQLCERGLVVRSDERPEEFAVGRGFGCTGEPASRCDHAGQSGNGHDDLRERTTVVRYPSWAQVRRRVAEKNSKE